MGIKTNIRNLRNIAFFLFLIPTLSLIGSLVFHNILVSFPFIHETNYKFENDLPGTVTTKYKCNQENNYCSNIHQKSNKLGKCNLYYVDQYVISETGELLSKNGLSVDNIEEEVDLKILLKKNDKKIFAQWKISEDLNNSCIRNSNLFNVYKFAPTLFEKIYKIKISKKTVLGTSVVVNPIIYGETSISNIVKRYPVKLIFKPLMYVSVILMIFYWYYNNLIFNKIIQEKNKNKFYIFGILSAVFLLLHVIFLGWVFENEILTKVRRSLIVFFILFEVLAQAFLIKYILEKKSEFFKFLNSFIVYCKLAFVFLVCFSTLIILIILLIVNLDSKIDYILEWNYFLILLFFYLLSSMMWKRN